MEAKAVVIKITSSEQFGKQGEIVAHCKSMFTADLFVTALERSELNNVEHETIGYISVTYDRINCAAASYSFHLKP